MFRKPLYLLLILLTLVSLACGVTVNLPVDNVTTGPLQKDKIKVDMPDAESANLMLNFGAGKLSIEPGAGDALVSGDATYNVPDFKPKIQVNKENVRIETGNLEVSGIPKFGGDIKNEWNLQLAINMPMDLAINAGAYEGDYDLGGIALQNLEISDGAADVRLKFSKPNQAEMDVFRYITGASNVKISDLANANFKSMIFRSGAGDYTLDFSGKLQRDAVVTIESGISNVTLIVPEGVSAHLIFKGGLASVDMKGGWKKNGDQYVMEGSGPSLTITIDLSAGNLNLRNS